MHCLHEEMRAFHMHPCCCLCCVHQMDIRQWVLVSELNPLTIWMFSSAYIRFSATAFDIDTLEDRCERCDVLIGCIVDVCGFLSPLDRPHRRNIHRSLVCV